MRKILLALLMLICLIYPVQTVGAQESLIDMTQGFGYPVLPEMAPKASIVINAENGQILWEENPNLVRDPASTTKAMLAYLTFEAISQGKVGLETAIVATESDQAVSEIYGLSNNHIQSGVEYSIRELLIMTLVPSSNAASLMLSRSIFEGDDAAFLEYMNQVARSLGMTHTYFRNVAGATAEDFEGHYMPQGQLPHATNESTAKDLALLTYYFLKKYPQVLDLTKSPTVIVKEGTEQEETLESRNHSLPGASVGMDGVDGLKTGSSPTAGYNVMITAKRGDVRLIAVLLGVGQWGDAEGELQRHYFANTLLENVFAKYQRKTILEAGFHHIKGRDITISEPLNGLVKEGEEPELLLHDNRIQLANSLDPTSGVEIVQEVSQHQELSKGTYQFLDSDFLWLSLLGIWLFLFLVLLFVFFSRLKKRKTDRNRRR